MTSKASGFRNFIKADGSSDFPAESGRYHLYVTLACPFAHRILIGCKLKGLEDVISYTVVDWLWSREKGWNITDTKPKCELDTVNNCKNIRELYDHVNPGYTGSITIPLLWDNKKKTIVNNESAEILRMVNGEFNDFCRTDEQRKLNLYPSDLAEEIDKLNSWISPSKTNTHFRELMGRLPPQFEEDQFEEDPSIRTSVISVTESCEINNGVYRTGFAKTQEEYDQAVVKVFEGLDKTEAILSKQRYLTGDRLTEADICLFTSLLRFDMIYVCLFKCNKKRIVDYPNLWGYTRDIYQINGIADTVDTEHIQHHYYESMREVNPTGIVAIGPDIDFTTPHNRENMSCLSVHPPLIEF